MANCDFGIIHWCGFDWQSFATLATGFAAVAAAWRVGKQQAEILKRQTELEEAKLRADLFARRIETFEVTADFIVHIATLSESSPEAEERINRFGLKMRESQFLFSDPNVYKKLLEFWGKGNEVRADVAISKAIHEEGGKQDSERRQRLLDYPKWQFSNLETLADIFRQDLSILDEKRSGK